jgi:uncharacterized protein YdeI (YjbR/CyaY-like superfamily)
MQFDTRVDHFIEQAEVFAKPILEELRKIIRGSDPNLVETIKWNFPCYTYNGKLICSFSAFKKHCSFGFWQAHLLADSKGILETAQRTGMGNLGKLTQLDDLPAPEVIKAYIHEAIEISQLPSPKKPKAKSSFTLKGKDFPLYFLEQSSSDAFDLLSASQRKDYISWIEEAKTELTKNRRITIMLDNLKEGKSLNWKYEK